MKAGLFTNLKLLDQKLVEKRLSLDFRWEGKEVGAAGAGDAIDPDNAYRGPVAQIQTSCYCSAVQIIENV